MYLKLKPMKKLVLLTLVAIFSIPFVKAICPDLIVTSMTVTKIYRSGANRFINFDFNLQNIGTDTVPAGGSFLSIIEKNVQYILPGASYSGSFSCSDNGVYNYFVLYPYFVNVTECNTDDNYFIQRIRKDINPDILFTSVTITKITDNTTYRTIDYDFTIRNDGTDTAFFSEMTLQNFVTTDSSYANLNAAGGTTFTGIDGTTKYIIPGATYSGKYSANDNFTYSFLIPSVSLTPGIEVNTSNNYFIQRINVISTGIKNDYQSKIIWVTDNKVFKVSGNRSEYNYLVFDLNGKTQLSGVARNNEYIRLPLRSGIYYIQVLDNNTKYSKKILIK